MASFYNASYRSHRTNLLRLMYPDDFVQIGQVVFKNQPFKGITAQIWLDNISISFNSDFLKSNPKIIETLQTELQLLTDYLTYKINYNAKSDKGAIMISPLDKNEFPETEAGIRHRASVHVLMIDLCLNVIAKHIQ